MTNKPKSHSNEGHANPDKDGREQYKRHVDGDIAVRGQVEVHVPPDTANKHDAERKEDNARAKKNYIVSLATLVAVLVYAAITFWQGCLTRRIANLTQRTYDTSERPYVGVYNIGHDLHYALKNRNEKPSIENADVFEFEAEIKNFGPVPATNFNASWKVFLNDVQVPGTWIPSTAATLYPTELMSLRGGIREGNDLKKLLHSITTLDIEVSVEYDGPQGHTTECSRHEYFAGGDGFFDLGKCIHSGGKP